MVHMRIELYLDVWYIGRKEKGRYSEVNLYKIKLVEEGPKKKKKGHHNCQLLTCLAFEYKLFLRVGVRSIYTKLRLLKRAKGWCHLEERVFTVESKRKYGNGMGMGLSHSCATIHFSFPFLSCYDLFIHIPTPLNPNPVYLKKLLRILRVEY